MSLDNSVNSVPGLYPIRVFLCVRGGEIYERGLRPLSLLHPSPARRIPHSYIMVPAGEEVRVR
jgi:hypothetical protein